MQLTNFLTLAFAATVSANYPSLNEVLTANAATLSTLTSLVVAQPAILNTLETTKGITILAPSNAAFAAFLGTTAGAAAAMKPDVVAALLEYHVLPARYVANDFTAKAKFLPTLLTNASYTQVTGGQRVKAVLEGGSVKIISGLLAESTVIVANIRFDGGFVHVIDKVLTIPTSDSSTAVAAGLTSLAGALTTANLVATVDGLKDVTIFAPTNAAFAAIASTVATLSVAELTSILTYHVIAGKVEYSTKLRNQHITTVNGAKVTITLTAGGIMVDKANVVIADVLVSNGVVHVIDSVLMPPAPKTSACPS